MMQQKFLIYIDILGFEDLTEEIAKKKGLEARGIRAHFIDIIKKRVKDMEARGLIIGKNYGGKDDWLLVTNSLALVFRITSSILDHNTGYENYEKIPLEIGIGVGEYDKWARYDGTKLVVENSTVKILKTGILNAYHNWYKQKHENNKIKSTFVVLTESVYEKLEPVDRRICQKIEYEYGASEKKEVLAFFVADLKKILERCKVFEFLEEIKRPGSKWYDRIDYVYVPPVEYQDINKTLASDRIVFITGTPEYGKTFTAVRLMWEYFNKGYEPMWRKGGEEWERGRVRERLEEIESELKPRRIIYFEDPFGKARYERRESLEREIGTIIDSIRNVEDVFVVITSREEVFKEFEKEHLSSVELRKFERKLNIKKPSYDYNSRRGILLKWARCKNCKWLEHSSLKTKVTKSLKDKTKLPTPLSIKDFVVSTIAIAEPDKLMQKLEEKSKETAKNFAKEISNMTDDRICFLLFPYISAFTCSFVALEYKKMVKELGITEYWDFDKILNWFKDDKISVSDGRIDFSHPSYSEAIEHLLFEKGKPTRINKNIYCRLLFRMSEESDVVAGIVARAVADNFDKLPKHIGDLLVELSKRDSTVARSVAWAVANNFDKLPKHIGDLLVELSKRDNVTESVAKAVAKNFNTLPDEMRNELLLKLAEGNHVVVVRTVVRAVANNFDKLPKHIGDLLVELSKRDSTVARSVVWAVADNFDKLPKHIGDLLVELSKRDNVAESVAWAVAKNFNKLPKYVRDLLIKLQDHYEQLLIGFSHTSKELALELISKTESKLDREFITEILGMLVKDENHEVKTKAQALLQALDRYPFVL